MTAGLERLVASIPAPDRGAEQAARVELDRKTKPRGSLGALEELAARIAAARGAPDPGELRPVVVVVAGDHGVAAQGVSAYPQDVTRQMLLNFVAGGAAICVLARHAGADLVVVDAGVVEPTLHPSVRDLRLGAGTRDASRGPAMTRAQAEESILRGAALADELCAAGASLLALGEMGIGNTTSSAALVAGLLGRDAVDVCGAGTGLDADGVARKVAVVRRMLDVNAAAKDDPLGLLAAVGGFEIGVLAGLALGGASARAVVLLDGFITGAAALVAARLAPAVLPFLVASHRSPEPGHAIVLEELALRPLLDLELRLGEGSGAALAVPVVNASLAVLGRMATFEAAGVTDAGR